MVSILVLSYRLLDMVQWLVIKPSLILAGYLNLPYHNFQEMYRKSQIVKGVRTEIISSVAWEIWRYTQYPSSEDYTTVCKLLVQKYPVLKDTIGNGFVSDVFYIHVCMYITHHRAHGRYN